MRRFKVRVVGRWILLLALVPFAVESRRATAEDKKARWIVVCAPAFQSALDPLCKVRSEQGFDVVRIDMSSLRGETPDHPSDARKLRGQLKALCGDAQGGCNILLVGAVPTPLVEGEPSIAANMIVPSLAGTIGRMRENPSDNGYGCIDNDLLPDVAVGRFPGRSVEEVKSMVRKTLAFEQQ